MSPNDRLLQQVEHYKPYCDVIQTAFIIIGGVLAILELREGTREARIANTLAFLGGVQTPAFHTSYQEGIRWLEHAARNGKLAADGHPADVNKKLAYVLDRFQSLWVLYDERIVDRKTVETAIGVQTAQFWLLTRHVLSEEERPGYGGLERFHRVLESSRTVRDSKTYQDLKHWLEKLTCKPSQ